MDREKLILDNLGIIAKLSLQYWRSLPISVASYFTVDDLISETVLHVVQVSKSFNDQRGKSSTFVWWAAQNHCREVLQRYSTQKRQAITCSIDSLQIARPDNHVRVLIAKDAVERIIEFASDDVRRFLAVLLYPGGGRSKTVKLTEPVRDEIRKLARQNGVTEEDFRIVLKSILAG